MRRRNGREDEGVEREESTLNTADKQPHPRELSPLIQNSARQIPVLARSIRDHVHGSALDHSPVCGVFHSRGI